MLKFAPKLMAGWKVGILFIPGRYVMGPNSTKPVNFTECICHVGLNSSYMLFAYPFI